MTKKKFFLDDKSKMTRKKTLDELKKKDIEINDEESISGGFVEYPRWLESPSHSDDTQKSSQNLDS